MPRKKPASKKIVPVTQEIEIILPLPDPETRGAFIQQRSQQLLNGEVTIFDIGQELKLSLQMIEFARLFVTEDFFGVGVECAARAYKYDLNTRNGLQSARNMASTLKKHAGVNTLLNCLLNAEGFNRTHMDKQLYFLCTQNEDLKGKGVGLKLYYQITGQLTQKIDIQVNHTQDLTRLDTDKLKQLAAILKETEVQED
ncbi:MAG TPA: hypothetical protein VK553_03215 [Candidatus Nitrosopolaris rasttigaisensis]|nr:hypothetical protein [Candidatus Nitrosopolaris rasttigaisensis]